MRLPLVGNIENAEPNVFATGANGFTNGIPGVQAPTTITAEQLNAVHGELYNAIVGGGLAINSNQYDQLDRVLKARIELNAFLSAPLNSVVTPESVNVFASSGLGRIVAVGDNAYIGTSDDAGATWTTRAAGSGLTLDLTRLLWVESLGLYVAAARAGGGGGGASSIQTSPDGITWTQRETPLGVAGGLAFGGGLLVAVYWNVVTDVYTTYTSANGTAWTAHAQSAKFGLVGITYGASMFVAGNVDQVTEQPYMYSSPDGITWTQRVLGSSSALKCPVVTFGVGYFAAYGNAAAGRELHVSVNGTTWTRVRADLSGSATLGCLATDRAAYFGGGGVSADWMLVAADVSSAFDFKAVKFVQPGIVRWQGRSHVALTWIDSTHIGRSAPFVL